MCAVSTAKRSAPISTDTDSNEQWQLTRMHWCWCWCCCNGNDSHLSYFTHHVIEIPTARRAHRPDCCLCSQRGGARSDITAVLSQTEGTGPRRVCVSVDVRDIAACHLCVSYWLAGFGRMHTLDRSGMGYVLPPRQLQGLVYLVSSQRIFGTNTCVARPSIVGARPTRCDEECFIFFLLSRRQSIGAL